MSWPGDTPLLIRGTPSTWAGPVTGLWVPLPRTGPGIGLTGKTETGWVPPPPPHPHESG